MKSYKNPVIVLGHGLSALRTVRNFGKKNIDVYIISNKKDNFYYSKYIKKRYMYNKYRNKNNLLNILKKISNEFRVKPVIYPTSDIDALNLSNIRNELSDDYYFVVGNKESVELIVNKIKFYKKLSEKKIPYPITYFPDSIEDVKKLKNKIKYPIFIKPAITQLFNNIFPSIKGLIVNSPKELINYYKYLTKYRIDIMFQQIISGPPTNSYQLEGYYNDINKPTILFARQRLRIWRPDFGNTALCISIPLKTLNKEIKSVNNFIKDINYSGLMSAEFKKDENDGQLKFLEINARVWWHIWLSEKCDADILFSSYLNKIGEHLNYVDKYKTGVKSVYLLNYLLSMSNNVIKEKNSLKDEILLLRGPKEYTLLKIDDISPFIMDNMFQIIKHIKS